MNTTDLQKNAGANSVQKATETGPPVPQRPTKFPLVHAVVSLCHKVTDIFDKGRKLSILRQTKEIETQVETKAPDGTIIRRLTRRKDTRFSLLFEDD